MLQKTTKVSLSILVLIIVGAISYVSIRSLGNKKIEKDKNLTNQVNNNLEPTDTDVSIWKTFKHPNDEKYSIKYPAQWIVDIKDSDYMYVYDPKFNKPIFDKNGNDIEQNNVLGMLNLSDLASDTDLLETKEMVQRARTWPTTVKLYNSNPLIKKTDDSYVDFVDGKISLAEFAKERPLTIIEQTKNAELLKEFETEKSYIVLVAFKESFYIAGYISDEERTKLFTHFFSCPNKEMLNYCGEIFAKMLSTFQY